MKKQVRLLIIGAVVLLALGGAYALLLWGEETEEDLAEQEAALPAASAQGSPLCSIALVPAASPAFLLERDAAGNYGLEGYSDRFRMDEERIAAAFSALESLETAIAVERQGTLSAYGLSAPVRSIAGTWENGYRQSYQIGAESPFGDGYYALRENDGAVIVIGLESGQALMGDMYDYFYGELMPYWEEPAREVYSVKLLHGEEAVLHCALRDEEELGELTGQAYSRYAMLTPVAASTSTYEMEQRLLHPLSALTRARVVDASGSALSQYGLDKPEYTLELLCQQGEIRVRMSAAHDGLVYLMRDDIPCVLALAQADVDFIQKLSYLDLINDYFWVHAMGDVASVELCDGTESHVLELGDGAARLDGREISETNATRLFLRILSISVAGEEKTLPVGGAEISFTIRYLDGREYSLAFSARNERYYTVHIDGNVTPLLTNVRDIQAVFAGIGDILDGKTLDPT